MASEDNVSLTFTGKDIPEVVQKMLDFMRMIGIQIAQEAKGYDNGGESGVPEGPAE